MSATNLESPILDGGIYWNNFFNGRLLSGEDLSQEQADNREGRRRLGKALGEGIAFGLDVSATPGSSPGTPTVTVSAGLAVNRQGQTLALAQATEVALVRPTDAGASSSAGFGDCEPTQPGVYIAGAGVYLLTLASASGTDGKAPTSGLGNIAATCNTRYTVEGIQFRLLALNLTNAELSNVNHLRNVVAYKCFGASDARASSFFENPFGLRVEKYGLLDDLRPDPLTDCDVPLAVIYWTASGIQFVDRWSVRRRIIPESVDADWRLLSSERNAAEAEAMIFQFQDHLRDLIDASSNPATLRASDYFYYLPPIGLAPLTGTGLPGIDVSTFFQSLPHSSVEPMDAALLRPLFQEATQREPITLASGEMILLYKTPQNEDAVVAGTAAQRYIIFVGANLLAVPGEGAGASMIATGLVEKSQFSLANVPGGSKGAGSESRATSAVTHGLGAVAVAVIIGLEDFGENPGPPNFERTVDRYYAFRDTGISTGSYQVVAEVKKPYDGTFKIFTNVGTMSFFDRIRWWAIRTQT